MSENVVQPTTASEAVVPDARDLMPLILAELADCEARFTERLYSIFFHARPDARPLFGAHPIAEQEEMMSETLHSLLAWADREAWLEGNLDALGKSHLEYGVTSDMYESFIEAMLKCGSEVLGDFLDDEKREALRAALEGVAYPMRDAGHSAQAAAAEQPATAASFSIRASG